MSDLQLVETTVGELRDALMRILHSIRDLEHRSDDILLGRPGMVQSYGDRRSR